MQLQRRQTYRADITQPDYFVVKHLDSFLREQLGRLLGKGQIVVDVGCGEQPLRGLIERLGGRYTGIDVNKHSQVRTDVLGTVTATPFREEIADIVICTEVLEHVSDTYRAFGELVNLTKPGGYLLITTPFSYPLHEQPHDFVRLTSFQIRELARHHGLVVEHIQESGNELEVMATLLDSTVQRMTVNEKSLIMRAARRIMRTLLNVTTAITSEVVSDRLPRNFYLNVMCVLRKGEHMNG